jgi:hypothetical protein
MSLGVSALTSNGLGAVKGLLAKKAYLQDSATAHTLIQIDVSLREEHSIQAPPSQFPVENGQVISDNIVIQPFALVMEGVISDTPVNPIATAVTSAISAIVPPSGIVVGGAAVAVFNAIQRASKTPSVQNFNQFVKITVQKRTVNVYTTLQFYKNMWLSELRVVRTAQDGACLSFTARFTQIILVQPQIVNIAKYANPSVSAAKANIGKISTDSSNIVNASFNSGFTAGASLGGSSANVVAQ